MEAEPMDSSAAPAARAPDVHPSAPANSVPANATKDGSSKLSASGLTSWAKGLKLPQTSAGRQDKSTGENSAKSAFARFTSGVGLHLSPRETPDQGVDGAQPQSNFFENFTKGIVDSSKSAVRAVSVKARHVVSQNKRRYQEDGFDLDMTYITENIIAMGFPAGDMSSGFFGYMEGFYRNHMEEVIRFLESRHKGRYKVYNLCSERLYDASLFEGKLASFPVEDHNCPPIQLIISFCQSAYSWLKEDIENVVVVHCKAGMARTGLMISSLLLYLKFFPTAEESIDYYNQKRCFDAKALVLPSQIRYVKYFERTLTYFNGENQPGRRCLLRGFRLHRCPYWIRPHITVSDHSGILFSTKKHPRTKDLSPEEFWFSAPKKGIMVFALPGEPGLTELAGDFKVHFHDRQGDFYFWLNTTMIENRKTLNTSDMDGFDKRKLPSPGFQVEVVLVDYDANASATPKPEETAAPRTNEQPVSSPAPVDGTSPAPDPNQDKQNPHKDESPDRDDVFSDSENEGSGPSKTRKSKQATSSVVRTITEPPPSGGSDQVESLTHKTEQVSLGKGDPAEDKKEKSATEAGSVLSSEGVSEFKVMAADASVFTFGDEDDYESD